MAFPSNTEAQDEVAPELRQQTIADPHRLSVLRRTALLDSPAEAAFDRMTRLATKVLKVPVSLVSLIEEDRQFFKSCVGLPAPWSDDRETAFSHSFCQYTVINREPLIVEDARVHPLVHNNLAIRDLDVIAYAGIPLKTSDGVILGSFCVIDTQPRRWTTEEIGILEDLAESVMGLIELRLVSQEAREAVALRERVLSVVSHDLKNPLAAIKGYVGLMKRRVRKMEGDGIAKLMEDLDQLNDLSNRMGRQIDELMEVTHLQIGGPLELRREAIDLADLVRRSAERHQPTSELHNVELESGVEHLVGEWDSARLERVFDNIIGNAIKYSPEGGTVRIEIERTHEDGRDWAVVRVSDQGLGISAADLPRIFDWYYRAAKSGESIKGNGIGLASAREIVARHGGSIEVDSTVGYGTTFTVRLPLNQA